MWHDRIAHGTFELRQFYGLNIMHIVLARDAAGRDTAIPFGAELQEPSVMRSHQRSAFRIVSDMVGDGALQKRTMSAGGSADSTATSVHPANDLVPDM
jgi:hypothetical protein